MKTNTILAPLCNFFVAELKGYVLKKTQVITAESLFLF